MQNNLEEKILKVVSDNHEKTAGHCGLGAVDIAIALDLEFADIRDALNNLYDNKKIRVREGINHHLIFKR